MADDFNPYSSPQATNRPVVEEGSGLKSLGQEARKTSLNKARWIMIVLGVLLIGTSIFYYVKMQDDLRNAERQGMMINHDVVQIATIIFVGTGVVGVLFIGMGIFIYSYPVPFTITAFVLYLADQVLGMVLTKGEDMHKGLLIKILIIAGLWQAIQAARAYEQERRMSPYDGF